MSIDPLKNDRSTTVPQNPIPYSEVSGKSTYKESSDDIPTLISTLKSTIEMVSKLRSEAQAHKAASSAVDKKVDEERGKGTVSLYVTQGLMKMAKSFGFNPGNKDSNHSPLDIGQQLGEKAQEKADEAMSAFNNAHAKVKEAQDEMQTYIDITDKANTFDIYADGIKNKVQSKSKGKVNIENLSNESVEMENGELPVDSRPITH